ncbi:hypothetical protein CHM34_15670 [Paludifilum halophilum]|uniref:Uncharacterized protein n=1 Tax=Paludifilum halophilum TaxID=1642702 RepID=A0A235B4J0_9BACL|nr:hypothetical protein CHM34_15670 [Paludifilum halophilum]
MNLLDQDILVLKKNVRGEKGSFIYFLHERNRFDEKSYREYFNSVINIVNKREPLDRDISTMLVKSYSYILRSFIFHLSPNDLSEIDKYPQESSSDYIENLNIVIESYFRGTKVDRRIF